MFSTRRNSRAAILNKESIKYDSFTAGIAEWLDHLIFVQRVSGSKLPSGLPQSMNLQPSVIPGKNTKGIMRCGHIKRKD